MKNKIKKAALKLGLDMCGVTSYNGKSVVVCLFPYYVNYEKGNISRYAAVKDYHAVVRKYLEQICEIAEINDFEIYADVSPYNEKELAYNAGLGVIGKNSLLINEKYGSYVFIGLIVLENIVLEEDKPLEKSCLKCGKCIKMCPGKALSDGWFRISCCLSEITQKKGELSDVEKKLIKTTGCVWGCDVCSEVCPMNENVTASPLPEFNENIISSIFLKDLEGLSNKEFRQKFSDRAFSWRGKNVLVRNCGVAQDCQPVDNLCD